MKPKIRFNKLIRRAALLYIPLAFYLIWALFPMYWMVITSIKSNRELSTLQNPLSVSEPTLAQYEGLLFNSQFPTWFLNSFVVSLVATLLSLIVSCLAAYAISRLKFKGRWLISRGVLFGYLVPRTILFLPLFAIVQTLRLTDTLQGLILVYLTFMVPFCTWLLIGYFSSVPLEIEECAILDGCSRLQVLTKIVLPITAPGIVTASLFSFTLSWNEFLYPLVINTMWQFQVVPVGVSRLMTGDIFEWGMIMATGVLFTVPLIFLYFPMQKYIAEGLTAGAVKG